MANASSKSALHPTGKQVRKSYLPQSTPKVRFLPPEEAIQLMSRNRARGSRTNRNQTRKPHQKRIQKLKPPVAHSHSAGSKSSSLKPKQKTSSTHGASVAPRKKPDTGVSMEKGQEKAPAFKKKSAHEDAPKSKQEKTNNSGSNP